MTNPRLMGDPTDALDSSHSASGNGERSRAVPTADRPFDTAVFSNELTARWAKATFDGASTAIAGAGVWPLLAILAASATGAARAELEAATGIDAAGGFEAAREVLRALREGAGVQGAFGVWTVDRVELDERWVGSVPDGTLGRLAGDGGDQARLDAWASEQTEGQIERMPVTVEPSTLMVIASALMARTNWLQPFEADSTWVFDTGPWAGIEGVPNLCRRRGDAADLRIGSTAAGALTTVAVRGGGAITVHLALGEPEASPGAVVAATIERLTDANGATDGTAVDQHSAAPGLTVHELPGTTPHLSVETVPFVVRADHDLLARRAMFGLETATDASRGHFPAITPSMPLCIDQARQSAMAAFTDVGFEAAAVTAVTMMMGSAFPHNEATTFSPHVRFDRPFGFVAVHEPSGLVLVAGWVSKPSTG